MKKIFFTIAVSLLLLCTANALPGFTSYIPDSPGEYVYYRDYSFEREAYVGLLCYDESTYQIRYYAPRAENPARPESSVGTLFTINPESDFFDMTGERILNVILPESDDIEILNYLHDLLYEFSARRAKADYVFPDSEFYKTSDNFWETGYSSTQDFEQFGGRVTITYDCTIPLFNIKAISAEDGSRIFECATTGTIRSSDDTTFEDFKGFQKSQAKTSVKTKGKKNKAKAKKYTTSDKQTVTLDEGWSQAMENFWTYGNDALLTLSSVPKVSEDELFTKNYIIRKLIQSSGGIYTNLSTLEILYNKDGKIKITEEAYNTGAKNLINNVKLLTPNENGGYFYYTLSVYSGSYAANSDYYDKILKSYKIKD